MLEKKIHPTQISLRIRKIRPFTKKCRASKIKKSRKHISRRLSLAEGYPCSDFKMLAAKQIPSEMIPPLDKGYGLGSLPSFTMKRVSYVLIGARVCIEKMFKRNKYPKKFVFL
jgi:hypothetical protein